MRVNPSTFQARADRSLRADLLAEKDVKWALRKIEERTNGFGLVSRRQLLTGALRLTRSMSPEVADTVSRCRDILGLDRAVEVYVRPNPMLQASAIQSPAGPLMVVLSSRLLEVFSAEELCFVIGHELGHMVYDHFGLPMPLTASIEDYAGAIVSRKNALRLYSWCRAAELSADRAGLVCARDPAAAASGFFKLASGLASPRIQIDLSAYARQLDSLASAPEAREKPKEDDDSLDCFSTHPYSPLRVKAVVTFSRSQFYRELAGLGSDGLSLDEVEDLIALDLAAMDPSYLEQKAEHAEAMRRLLYCAGLCVAAADGQVDRSELDALRALLGAEAVSGTADPDAARKELETLIESALHTFPHSDCVRLIQHLTLIASADGHVHPAEVSEMHRICHRLRVDPMVIEQTLDAATHPLD